MMDFASFDETARVRGAYRFWIDEAVRFTDLDALGHVSAVRTHEFFNSARARLFHDAIPHWPRATHLPVLKLSVVQNEREMHFPLQVQTGLSLVRWGRTSMTLALGLFAAGTDDCLALSRNLFVFIDAETRASAPPPETVRDALNRLAA